MAEIMSTELVQFIEQFGLLGFAVVTLLIIGNRRDQRHTDMQEAMLALTSDMNRRIDTLRNKIDNDEKMKLQLATELASLKVEVRHLQVKVKDYETRLRQARTINNAQTQYITKARQAIAERNKKIKQLELQLSRMKKNE